MLVHFHKDNLSAINALAATATDFSVMKWPVCTLVPDY